MNSRNYGLAPATIGRFALGPRQGSKPLPVSREKRRHPVASLQSTEDSRAGEFTLLREPPSACPSATLRPSPPPRFRGAGVGNSGGNAILSAASRRRQRLAEKLAGDDEGSACTSAVYEDIVWNEASGLLEFSPRSASTWSRVSFRSKLSLTARSSVSFSGETNLRVSGSRGS